MIGTIPFISLIIPVYNVEKYLRQCVDSVISQHYSDMEVILVDDGSADQSPAICDDYGREYPFIRVIHKSNGGLSSARNAGIEAAAGKYLMFMDSDDWWNTEVKFETLVTEVQKQPETEMFLFCSFDYVENQGFYIRNEHRDLNRIRTDSVMEYYRSLLDNGNLEVSACTKILKSDFIRDNKLYFKEGIVGEDNEWMIRLLRVLQSVAVIPEYFYICRKGRSDSITNSIGKKNIKDLLDIVEGSLGYHKENRSELKESELCFASYLWFSALGLSSKLKGGEKKELADRFRQTQEVCDYSKSKKTKLCRCVYQLFGLSITGRLLGTYITMNNRFRINMQKQGSDKPVYKTK